jgi:cytochrome oxidase Cu insertion factor (SCO1/SenC/PrrC family)
VFLIVLAGVVLGGLGYVLTSLLSAENAGAGSISDKTNPSAYEQSVPVSDFTLTDQTGQPFTLSSTKGKIVLMAFLYTHCGDVCPYLALKMRLALERLGDQAKNVELVAVDTDPERDTVPVLAAYSKDLGLYDTWHIVTGTDVQMKAVYQQLKITVLKTSDVAGSGLKGTDAKPAAVPAKSSADSYVAGLDDAEIHAGSAVARKYFGGYQIVHSAPFWILDAHGDLRTSLDFSATPAQLVESLQVYLKTLKS